MSCLKNYEYVMAVASCGGVSQAAAMLNIAQPTLSKYLKKLENDLGIELFDRSTIPLKTTEAGEQYIETGKRMLDLERQLQKQLQELKLNKNTTVRVGISPSRSPYLMPAIVEMYKKANSSGRIVIEERTTAELNSRLASGDLDVIISLLDEGTAAFEQIELFDETVMLASAKGANMRDLSEATFINVGSGQAMWKTANEIIEKLGAKKPEIECQSIESALSLVKKGLGVMVIPSYIEKYCDERQREQLQFSALPDPDLYKRKVCLFYRKTQVLTQSEKQFIDCVKNTVK